MGGVFLLKGAYRLTSKRSLGLKRLPKKPLAAIQSSLAPSSVIAEAPVSASPVVGCGEGSTHTYSWLTSYVRFAVKSLTGPVITEVAYYEMGPIAIQYGTYCTLED